ncbi:O-acetyl-ADP-ribose deacetylase, partial [Candidatus Micrarchaeota archaeon CG06_land_8_20_14_3_00_50_6]
AYRESLKLAVEKGLKGLSFPSISTGAYGYPVEPASRKALQTVIAFVKENPSLEEVAFVL